MSSAPPPSVPPDSSTAAASHGGNPHTPGRPTANIDKVRQVEILISTLLRVGVIVSLAVVVCGTILSFTHHHDYAWSPDELTKLTRIGTSFPHDIQAIIRGTMELRGSAIVMVGLLLLIATPVARVAVSIFAFVYEGDRIFVLITSLVLALLILSFVLGAAE